MLNHYAEERLRCLDILEALLGAHRVVLLSKDGDGVYTGTASGGRNRTSVALTLEGCLDGLTDAPRVKVCIRQECKFAGRPQPLWKYTPDYESADGHAAVCKSCETRRQRGIAIRKKGKG